MLCGIHERCDISKLDKHKLDMHVKKSSISIWKGPNNKGIRLTVSAVGKTNKTTAISQVM